jgi:hypothetical protein
MVYIPTTIEEDNMQAFCLQISKAGFSRLDAKITVSGYYVEVAETPIEVFRDGIAYLAGPKGNLKAWSNVMKGGAMSWLIRLSLNDTHML